MKLFDRIVGRLSGTRGVEEGLPPLQPVQMVPGGRNAPELCMLLEDADRFPAAPGPFYMQLKLDGLRCLYIDGKLFSREGSPMNCALQALEGLRRLERSFGRPMFFDAEYVNEAGYDASMADFKRGQGTGVVWIHDCCPLDDWMRGVCAVAVEDRLEQLKRHYVAANSVFVGVALPTIVSDMKGAVEYAAAMMNGGYEGAVVKAKGTPYVRQRSNAWLKIKRKIVKPLPIIDVLTKGTAFKGIIVRGPTGPMIITNGFNEAQKKALLKLSTFDNYRAVCRWSEKAGSNKPRHAHFLHLSSS